jgi:CheY-like chemotaxis protein
MPGGDGYQLIERIRRTRGCALPVVALTAYASQAEHEAIVRAGFQLHLRKPIDPVELARCLNRVGPRALSTSQP